MIDSGFVVFKVFSFEDPLVADDNPPLTCGEAAKYEFEIC